MIQFKREDITRVMMPPRDGVWYYRTEDCEFCEEPKGLPDLIETPKGCDGITKGVDWGDWGGSWDYEFLGYDNTLETRTNRGEFFGPRRSVLPAGLFR